MERDKKSKKDKDKLEGVLETNKYNQFTMKTKVLPS